MTQIKLPPTKPGRFKVQGMQRAELISANLCGAKSLIQSYGVDPIIIAKNTKMPLEALERDDMVIDALTFYHFLMEAAAQCKERFIGIKLAELQDWRIIDGAWKGRSEGHTIADILNHSVSVLELSTSAITAYMTEYPDGCLFCFEVRWNIQEHELLERDESLVVEFSLGKVCLELRKIFGKGWYPPYVQFRHGRPESVRPLQRCFGERVSFNQDCNAIFLTHDELATPIPHCRNKRLQQRAITPLRTIDETFSWELKVDREIRKSFLEHECSIDTIAGQLELSVRGLQRRLKREGVSYQEILDKIRIDWALHYLENSYLGVSDVAERLHYSETAVFSRFFKNRTGISPSELVQRRKAQNKGTK